MSTPSEKYMSEHVDHATKDLEKHVDTDRIEVPSEHSHHKSKQERRLVIKQDLVIVALLSGCFFFAYLDRGNLGNARAMGFQQDLHLTDQQFFNGLMVFFVGYMIFELPAALSLRIFRPGWAYGTATILFGVFACCLSTLKSYGPLLVIRLFIGLAEAFIQTGWVFLSLWYKHDEMATRTAFYYGSAPVAGAVSGLIAYGCEKHLNGVHGLRSWQWLFIVEGIPTIAWGILVFLCIPQLPEIIAKRGSWLFPGKTEQDLVLKRTIQAHNTPSAKPVLFQVWWGLKDPKTWVGALSIAAPCLSVAAFGSFLPTFIKEFGFSALDTQLYTMIPYAFATVSTPVTCIISDRLNRRAIPLTLCLATSIAGFVILLASSNPTLLIVGCCFVATGAYPGVVLAANLTVVNHAGYTKRSTAWAVAQVFIQCYSIISTQIYVRPPHFYMGHGVLLGLNAVGFVALVVMYTMMKRSNQKRDAVAAAYAAEGRADPDSGKSYEELCDYHPLFRYSL